MASPRDDHFLSLNLAGVGLNLKGTDLAGLLSGNKGSVSVGGLTMPAGMARLAIGAGAAAAALTAIVGAATGAAHALRELGGNALQLGSSVGQARGLSLLGSALGIGNVAGSAAALHAATLSFPGIVRAGQLGLPIRPTELGGATDRGDMLITALEGLRSLPQSDAIATARDLHIEEWLPVIYLFDEQWQKLRQEMEASSGLFSQERIAQAMSFNLEMARFNQALSELAITIGEKIMPTLTTGLQDVNDLLKGDILSIIMRRQYKGEDAQKTALDANTAATNQNTAAMERMGHFGGGRRFRSALPAAFAENGFELNKALRGNAQQFGALPVGF